MWAKKMLTADHPGNREDRMVSDLNPREARKSRDCAEDTSRPVQVT